MTREHKLALILGFAVLMVVGVLVGDHFSRARTVRAQPDLAAQKPAPASESPESTPVPVLPPERQVAVVPPSGGPGAGGSGGTSNGTNPQPTIVMGHPDRSIPEGFRPAAQGDTAPNPLGGGHTSPQPTDPEGSPVGPGLTPPGTPVAPTLPVSTGKERQHPVQDNETLYTIAKRYYGDAALWNKLAEYNKGRVKANGAVREGVTLRIPPKDVLLGQATLAGSAPAPRAMPTGPDPTPPGPVPTAPAGGPRTYTVKKGDTLGTISKSQLGSARRWEEIMSLNRDKLDDESSLQIGMVLKLPAR